MSGSVKMPSVALAVVTNGKGKGGRGGNSSIHAVSITTTPELLDGANPLVGCPVPRMIGRKNSVGLLIRLTRPVILILASCFSRPGISQMKRWLGCGV